MQSSYEFRFSNIAPEYGFLFGKGQMWAIGQSIYMKMEHEEPYGISPKFKLNDANDPR
jgi:hypothetical protein